MFDTKQCSKCGEVKPLAEYHKAKTCRDGRRGECKPCYREKIKAHYSRNREEVLANQKRYREENKERISDYHRKRRPEIADRLNAYARQYREDNLERCAALAAKYRAAKLQQTASWANDQLIAAYYKEAKRLEELTGIHFHVDHIIPLQGELVSGLHVETNLQLLPAHENLGKSNSFDPMTFAA